MGLFGLFKKKKPAISESAEPLMTSECKSETSENQTMDYAYYCTPFVEDVIETPESASVLPTYYEPFAKNVIKTSDGYRFQLCAQDSSEDFEIWYYGNLIEKTLITCTDEAFSKVVAKSLFSGEEIIIFDGISHGYDNLTWQGHEKVERKLKKSDFGTGKIYIETQSLPDDENDWKIDECANVIIENKGKIAWSEFKRNAITYLEINLVTENGKKKQIVSEELA